MASHRPIALTISGSDCSGGAGIQADLKTFGAFDVYGASVITALTAQNTTGVADVHDVPPGFVAAQLTSIFDDLDVAAVKTGMLANAPIIDEVARCLDHHNAIPVVVDPVMVATSGDALLADDAVVSIIDRLLPRATVITPNLDEAAKLLDTAPATSHADMISQGEALLQRGARAVLVKGGHAHIAADDTASDVLVTANGQVAWFSAPRVDTRHTHGTGCTLASAIAAGLARGRPLSDAIQHAKAYLTKALIAGQALQIGHGSGPVDHLIRPALDQDQA